ncbi:MAG: fumarylacetoacetate hydrolase family protein [Anaerolineae bacterium]|nr:fumarylacetoacetate hydrolase family protein [Anaerolineae bacterium]
MNKIAKAAAYLMQARLTPQRLLNWTDDTRPDNFIEAYAVQDAFVEQLLAHYGGRTVGYKIACTNEAAQRDLHVDGPFSGRLLSNFVYDSPAQLYADDFFIRVIEPEYGVELGQDLPPRSTPYSRQEVADAVGAIMPAIEIVDSRFEPWTTIGAISLIADQAVHGAWVIGERVTNWRDFDLATQEISLWVDGALNQTGSGAAVLGHPFNSLTWLVNALSAKGQGLKTGDLVTTGICVDKIYYANPGEVVKADFGPIGSVTVSF